MTPTHANKAGVRYRYYVSHALLQARKGEAGFVGRVSAPDIEHLVIGTVRAAFNQDQDASDQDLIRKRLEKAIVFRDRIEMIQSDDSEAGAHSAWTGSSRQLRTGLRETQTSLGQAHGQIPEIGNSRLETGLPIGLQETHSRRSPISASTKARGMRAYAPVMAKSPNSGTAWLGREDSNLRMAESKSAALPLGYAPIRRRTAWVGGKRPDHSSRA